MKLFAEIIKNLKALLSVYIYPKFIGSFNEITTDKETILIVSHEASLSGAPILCLCMAEELSKQYHVVILTLGFGPLITHFRQSGAIVIIAPWTRQCPQKVQRTLGRLFKQQTFKYALVNTVESRAMLPVLAHYKIPTISLFHEFAAYIQPVNAFVTATQLSTKSIFSTKLTRDNACALNPELKPEMFSILPQGRCLSKSLNGKRDDEQRRKIDNAFRPLANENNFVILGAGLIQIRKGVDLFIECATRLKQLRPDLNFRFVWIGDGYDPKIDLGYSLYLLDQIQRANLENNLIIIPTTSEIIYAYQQADLFLLSSRLDPLPNVAIDALHEGLPLICFDKTTGIADFLIEHGAGAQCVADYLNPEDIARKISVLLDSKDLRLNLAEKLKQAAIKQFNMKDYIKKLDTIASD